jgi:hypothetical protein
LYVSSSIAAANSAENGFKLVEVGQHHTTERNNCLLTKRKDISNSIHHILVDNQTSLNDEWDSQLGPKSPKKREF